MTGFLIFLLSAECVAILAWAFVDRSRLIQLPFLAMTVVAGWVLPQFIGLSVQNNIPGSGLDKTIFMTILCLTAICAGYGWNPAPTQLLWWKLDRGRLLAGAAVLCAIGGFFAYRVSQLAPEVNQAVGGQWTGVITIYVFFTRLILIGTVIAFLIHLRRPSWQTWCILLLSALFFADRILLKGRRADMVEFAVALMLGLWFQRRIAMPRWAAILALCAGALVINGIGDYRNVMLGADRATWSGAGFKDVANIDFVGNFVRGVTGQKENFELTNAAMNIEATTRLGDYDFGRSLWNAVVDTFVPAQLLGSDAKAAMKFDLDDAAYSMFRYSPFIGTTATGMSTAFESFWYFGALEFLVIGLFMGRWFRAAAAGNFAAQLVVILMMVALLQCITHSTQLFVTELIGLCLFLLPVLLFARVSAPEQAPASVGLRRGGLGARPVLPRYAASRQAFQGGHADMTATE
jgi:hypothetical protein